MKIYFLYIFLLILIGLRSLAQDTININNYYMICYPENNLEPYTPSNTLIEDVKSRFIAKYPFYDYKGNRAPSYGRFRQEYWGKLPTYVYENINTLKKIAPEEIHATLAHRFIPTNGNYYLVNVLFGSFNSMGVKELLVSYDTAGHLSDYLETKVVFDPIYLKQYKLTSDMQVIVYHLNLQPTDFTEEPPHTQSRYGQRIDTYYQIDSTGKFRKIKEIRYKPQIYTADYLNDETVNIWEGQEEKMPSVQ